MADYESISCFKAYDIRGKVPSELNPDLAGRIGRAFVEFLSARRVVVGRDVRASGPELSEALIQGMTAAGADVLDIGLCGTEMVYFATAHLETDGGIMITASHNPPEYNGMKFVREGSRPISSDTGLKEIERLVSLDRFKPAAQTGSVKTADVTDDYIKHLLTYINVSDLPPYKLAVNAGNGCAGPIVDRLEPHLPFTFIKVHHKPDETFPNGIPNPLLPKNRASTSEAVVKNGADIGIAWDGDFDRCFLFDEKGNFIEGYYIVGFLAQALLARHPAARIVYDPRVIWNTIEIVNECGGTPVMCKSGHSFIKDRMRSEDAIYGGEMSAHHYFKDFFFSDSGMVPWLLVLEIMGKSNKPLSQLVEERIERYPVSGEINRRVENPDAVIEKIRKHYEKENPRFDETDGISIEFPRWRMNVRKSNTEPVIRLNVETRQDTILLKEKTGDVTALIDS